MFTDPVTPSTCWYRRPVNGGHVGDGKTLQIRPSSWWMLRLNSFFFFLFFFFFFFWNIFVCVSHSLSGRLLLCHEGPEYFSHPPQNPLSLSLFHPPSWTDFCYFPKLTDLSLSTFFFLLARGPHESHLQYRASLSRGPHGPSSVWNEWINRITVLIACRDGDKLEPSRK